MSKLFTLTVLAFLGLLTASGQDSLLVKGIIVDGANQPIENVSVGVEGSYNLPSFTNKEGEFNIKAESGEVWLNIAPPGGFKPKRVHLYNRREIKIFLSLDDLEAGDDVISALEQQHLRKDLVSSFNTLNVEDIGEAPVMSIDQYMQGRISGMHVTNRSGNPAGGAVSFQRGVNSINANNEPLYVVDGVPFVRKGVFMSVIDGYEYNPLLGINPMDISKITVSKDPALNATYGSKASNGLILIETLDPSSTQTSIDIDLRRGHSLAPSNLIPQLDASQHKTLISEVLFTSGMEEELVREQYPQLFSQPGDDDYVLYSHNTNWQEQIFTDASFTNLNIKVKGGDEIATYGLSFGFVDGKGIVKETKYTGYNLRFRGLLNIFTWLKMNSVVSLNYNNASLKESAQVAETSPIFTGLAKSPLLNPYQYNAEGNELDLIADVDQLGVSNPLAVIQNNEANNNNFNSSAALGFEIKLKENLHINTKVGINYTVLQEQMFMPNKGMELYYNDEAINVAKVSNNSLFTLYNNTALNYHQSFGNHKISSATGVNIQTNTFQFDWALTKNSPENDEYPRLQDGTPNLREIGGANRDWNWLSFYESFTYSYKDKYMALASVSLDGSSRIGDNALNTIKIGGFPFGVFYSAGAAWRLSNEAFLRDLANLEELKLRFSYGITGNDDVGEENATKYYQAIKYRETVGLIPATFLNDELTYERVSQINLGIDLALRGNRFRTSVDVYESKTEDMLIYSPLSAYLGYIYRAENGGNMKNEGIDVNLFYRVIDRKNFKWDVQASYSTVRNEVTEIKGDKLVTPIPGAEIVNMPGEQANSFYGYIFEGDYATFDQAESMALVNNKFVPYQAGDAIYKDISGPNGTPDGIINDFDKTVIGSSIPEHWGGVSTTLTYKRWALSAFVQFVSGNEVFNYVRYKNESMLGIENQSTTVLDRWQNEGQETMVPRADYGDFMGNSEFSTRWIEDGSFLRLKNIAISYTIPGKFLVFKNAKFYFSATNLFIQTKYLGYDPEFAYSSSHISQGIDYGLTPQPRQFIIGIKLGL